MVVYQYMNGILMTCMAVKKTALRIDRNAVFYGDQFPPPTLFASSPALPEVLFLGAPFIFPLLNL
jgi:hypothetical protein